MTNTRVGWIYMEAGLSPADLDRVDHVIAAIIQDYRKQETSGGTWYAIELPDID